MKYIHNGEQKILGDLHPFTLRESHYTGTSFYPTDKEVSVKKPHAENRIRRRPHQTRHSSSKSKESSSYKAPSSSQQTWGHSRLERLSRKTFVKILPSPELYSPIRLGSDLEEESPQKFTSDVIFLKEMFEALKHFTFPLNYMSLHPIEEAQIKISRPLGQHQQTAMFYSVLPGTQPDVDLIEPEEDEEPRNYFIIRDHRVRKLL